MKIWCSYYIIILFIDLKLNMILVSAEPDANFSFAIAKQWTAVSSVERTKSGSNPDSSP
jgi:hypothetical protein